MSSKKPAQHRTQVRKTNVSLYSLTPEQAVRAILQISPADVKRIVGSKRGKQKGRGKW